MCYIWKRCWLNIELRAENDNCWNFINCQINEESNLKSTQTFSDILLVYVKER